MKKNDIKVISKKKLLCINDNYKIFAKGCNIFVENRKTKKEIKFVINDSNIYFHFSKISIFRRLFRLEPRCGCFLDNSTAIFSMRGSIYKIDVIRNNINKEHSFREGMNNPLSFTIINNIEGFENGVVYGDYIGRGIKGTIDIHLRTVEGFWKKVFSFPENQIKHIHNIIPSTNQKCLFVLTGDSDTESAIWKIENNYNKITRIVGGSQIYRGCVCFENENGLIYATDIPTQQNYIYFLNYSNMTLKVIAEISGPCIYGTKLKNGMYVFGTSVEPDDNIKGIKSLVCFKHALGVKDNCSHIYVGNLEVGFEDIYQRQKDRYPMPLLGLGVFQFPDGLEDELYATIHALKGIDGCTIKISL